MPGVNIPNVGMEIPHEHRVEGQSVTYAMQDSFRLLGSCALVDSASRDLAGRKDRIEREQRKQPPQSGLDQAAHRDHIQIIRPPAHGQYNQQFAAAGIEQVLIQNCLLYSPDTKMQGIFASDGFIRYAMFIDNEIVTSSEHKISVCAFDGVIKGNTDANGNPVHVNLTGLRIAGGLEGKPLIKIMSFADPEDYYARADQIVHEEAKYYTDERETFDDNTIHLEGFDRQAFRAAARQVASHDCDGKARGAVAMCHDFHALAQQYGTPVKRIY